MANNRDLQSVLIIGLLALIVMSFGLFLGFQTPPKPGGGKPVPKQPDRGPIVYEMRAVRSDPDRVRLEWRDVSGASGYRVTVMTAEDESLFVSPVLATTVWTIPPHLRPRLEPQSSYHWKLTVLFPDGGERYSEPAAFATQ